MRLRAKTLTLALLASAVLLTGCVAGSVPDFPTTIPEFETAGNNVGTQLKSGTRIEAGSFTFPDNELRGRERHQLSESVTVISEP